MPEIIASSRLWQEFANPVQSDPNLVTNPYYLAFGGVTISTAGQSALQVEDTGAGFRVVVTSPIEVYDHYDWCFGNQQCNATGTHPMGMTVGEFFALEKAGWAAQFNVYGDVEARITYDINCSQRSIVMSFSSVEAKGTHLDGSYWQVPAIKPQPPIHWSQVID